ncbi:uncharacterized protein [Physeter macrocephalus]|uniref:Uncharacterized protein isoform X4 n=1 Tax=Physeter macrocephalus TaxID=9755 RepID=A0A9W2W7E0_PHYMC|nr:uncharacterized protein LOC112065221 isoform X4 [Physeter catodon]
MPAPPPPPERSMFATRAKKVKMATKSCPECDQQEVLIRTVELTNYHQPEEFGEGQKERGDSNPYVLPTSQNPSHWNPSWLNNAHATRKHPESE